MAESSMREAFQDATHKPFISIRDVFTFWQSSLREMERILTLPLPDLSTLKLKKIDMFGESEGQGITFISERNKWVVSVRFRIFECQTADGDLYDSTLHETGMSLTREEISDILQKATSTKPMTTMEIDHIGAAEYYNGLIFAPIESEDTDYGPPTLVAFDSELRNIVAFAILDCKDDDCGFCAINPFNGYLYTNDAGEVDRLKAYDVSEFYKAMNNPSEWPKEVSAPWIDKKDLLLCKDDGSPDHLTSLQGAVFSKNGRVYLSRSPPGEIVYTYDNFITAFSSLTGRRIGEWDAPNFEGHYDEIEGICIHPSGVIYFAVSSMNGSKWTDIYALKYSDANTHT